MAIAVFSIAQPPRAAVAAPVCWSRPRRARRTRAHRMNRHSLLPWLSCFATACSTVAVTGDVGYARLALAGDLSLASGNGAATEQDVDDAFGLGAVRDVPYLRVGGAVGPVAFDATGFWLRESGTGVLSETFGGIPAGTSVTSDLELGVARLSAVWGFELGPVRVAPGLAFDVFAIDFTASSSPGNREEVDDVVAVPLPCVRTTVAWRDWTAGLDVGWFDPPHWSGVDGRFFDLEATARWHGGSRWHVAAGYRWLGADAEGDAGADTFGLDLSITGWFVGVGLRF